MGSSENSRENNQIPGAHSEIILNELRTLSLHSKLVLYACIRLFSEDHNVKITVMDVFKEYKKLTAGLNISWLSMNKVTEHIKELEMLGFLKCTYPPKGLRQIRYIYIFEPAEIPRYVAILKEDLGKKIQ